MRKRTILAATALLASAGLGLAVGPAAWNHATEADFTAGTAEKVVISNLGEVKLSRATETLLAPREDLGMVSACALDGQGRVFVAGSPEATVYRLENGKAVKFAALPGVLVRSLLTVKDDLVAGVSGKSQPGKEAVAGVYRIDAAGKVKPIWTDSAVTFVWAIVPGPRGALFVATGPEGKVFRVAPDGKAAVVYDSDDDNVMSLTAGKDGILYAGTGENGLIVEIDIAKGKGRVLYDAPEKEVSALVVDADGSLYASTSDASKAGGVTMPPSEIERPRAVPGPAPTRPLPEAASGAASGVTPPALAEPSGSAGATASVPTRPTATASAPSGAGAAPVQVARPIPALPTAPRGLGPLPPSGPESEGSGNAVYRIDAAGFVRAVFRRPVTILSMLVQDGTLILGTGHGGQIFTVNVAEERSGVLVKVDPHDVTALAADAKGRVVAATADKAAVYALAGGHADKGTLVSKVLDAGQIARWGTLSLRADVPAGCSATIATRSGNVAEAKDNTWSDWSAPIPAGQGWSSILTPPGRYFQYRLTLSGNGQATPMADQVRIIYQVANLAPVVRTVQVAASPAARPLPGPMPGPGRPEEADQPLRYRIVQIKADDPNSDALQYSIHARKVGRQSWIKLAEKLTDPQYVWDTLGTEDGQYELRVEAADAPSNPPATALKAEKVSRPVLVDNTAPQAADLAVKPGGKGELSISGTAVDATSRIKQIAYSIDSNDEWTVVLPADGICDSSKETFAATAKDVKDGPHRVALRVLDELNNAGYSSVEVTVGK